MDRGAGWATIHGVAKSWGRRSVYHCKERKELLCKIFIVLCSILSFLGLLKTLYQQLFNGANYIICAPQKQPVEEHANTLIEKSSQIYHPLIKLIWMASSYCGLTRRALLAIP